LVTFLVPDFKSGTKKCHQMHQIAYCFQTNLSGGDTLGPLFQGGRDGGGDGKREGKGQRGAGREKGIGEGEGDEGVGLEGIGPPPLTISRSTTAQ
jgi:hypothetical protein